MAVRLCLSAASPAGVSGSLNPGRSFADVTDWRGVASPLPITAQIRMPISGFRRRPAWRRLVVDRRQAAFLSKCGGRIHCHAREQYGWRHEQELWYSRGSPLQSQPCTVRGSGSPGPPSPAEAPETMRPSGNVTRLASTRFEPSFAR